MTNSGQYFVRVRLEEGEAAESASSTVTNEAASAPSDRCRFSPDDWLRVFEAAKDVFRDDQQLVFGCSQPDTVLPPWSAAGKRARHAIAPRFDHESDSALVRVCEGAIAGRRKRLRGERRHPSRSGDCSSPRSSRRRRNCRLPHLSPIRANSFGSTPMTPVWSLQRSRFRKQAPCPSFAIDRSLPLRHL